MKTLTKNRRDHRRTGTRKHMETKSRYIKTVYEDRKIGVQVDNSYQKNEEVSGWMTYIKKHTENWDASTFTPCLSEKGECT